MAPKNKPQPVDDRTQEQIEIDNLKAKVSCLEQECQQLKHRAEDLRLRLAKEEGFREGVQSVAKNLKPEMHGMMFDPRMFRGW